MTEHVRIVLDTTPRQKKALEQKARSLGMTKTALLRALIQEAAPVMGTPMPEEARIRADLTRAQAVVGELGGRRAVEKARGGHIHRARPKPAQGRSHLADRVAELIAEGKSRRIAESIADAERRATLRGGEADHG